MKVENVVKDCETVAVAAFAAPSPSSLKVIKITSSLSGSSDIVKSRLPYPSAASIRAIVSANEEVSPEIPKLTSTEFVPSLKVIVFPA